MTPEELAETIAINPLKIKQKNGNEETLVQIALPKDIAEWQVEIIQKGPSLDKTNTLSSENTEEPVSVGGYQIINLRVPIIHGSITRLLKFSATILGLEEPFNKTKPVPN